MSTTTKVVLSDANIQSLCVIAENSRATAKQAGLTAFRLNRLLSVGVIKPATANKQAITVKNQDENGVALRGRPSRLFTLTNSGRAHVKRAQAAPVAA